MKTGDRVLVTGAAGHLGGHAARLLAAAGHEVYGTSRRDGDAGSGEAPSGIQWLSCDLTKPGEVRAAVKASKPSHVLHAVGIAGDSDLEALVASNVVSLANLVDGLAGVHIERLVVIGSGAEYAQSGQEPIREDHPLAPTSRYGLSKLYQFELSQMALRAGMPVVYARPFSLVGPGISCATAVGDISKRLADAVSGRGSGVLEVGDLERWRDYVDVRDAAAACTLLLEVAPSGAVYNVCSGVPVRLADVVDRLLSMAGKAVRLHRVEGNPSVKFQVGDSSRLRALGWSPAFDLDTSLRDGLDVHLKSGRDS
jgi:nucleoside-diphosphate-sugar epimerase